MSTSRILAIDIGNSFTHFGLFQKKALIVETRLPTSSLPQKKNPVLDYLISPAEALIIASVVPGKEKELKRFLKSYRKKVYSLKDGLSFGLAIDYEGLLGEDRICAACGVAFHYKRNGIVVDLGSATTFSCVAKEGKFLGGIIAPGITSSLLFLERANLLRQFAPHFSQRAFSPRNIQPPAIAKNTKDGLEKGIYFWTKYAIEGIIKRLKGEIKRRDVSVFLTGGLSFVYKYILAGIDIVDPFLNLRGLCEIYYLNRR